MEHDKHQGGETDNDDEQGEDLRPVPRIYVASLADYVDGRLHGSWLDVTGDLDDLNERIKAMLEASPLPGAEEWAIHDFDNFAPLQLGEYESLARIAMIGRGVAEHGEAFKHWAAVAGTDRMDLFESFEDAYHGHWETVEEFAESLWADFGYQAILEQAIPDDLQPYVRFDVEAFARDLQLGGDIVTSEGDGGVYVFNANA